ncbi:hypothetical protein [Microbacterium pumilum]|uniref:Uncharacterized protein n=1 Tax=Microbacterium pumilum TaxID=344165 RepID=A0ABN2SS33_9MICO
MGTETVPSDDALEVELAALRARAYGADADIERDPDALGRLAELEEWHAAWVNSVPEESFAPEQASPPSVIDSNGGERERSSSPPATAGAAPESSDRAASRVRSLARSQAGLFGLGAAAMAAVVLLGAALVALGSPRPDMTLPAVDTRPGSYVYPLVDRARDQLIDKSTLRTYERYRGIELWSAQSAVGNTCLLALERSSSRLLGTGCVPPGADPVVQIYDVPIHATDRWHYGLPTGTVVRFILSGDVVSVWLYLGTEGD